MATEYTTYTQTLVTTPTQPSTSSVFDYDIQFPLYREIVKRDLIDEPEMKKELTAMNILNSRQESDDVKTGEDILASIINPVRNNGGK